MTYSLNIEISLAIRHLLLVGKFEEARKEYEKYNPYGGIRDMVDPILWENPIFPESTKEIIEVGTGKLFNGDLFKAIEWLSEGVERLKQVKDQKQLCGVLGDLALAYQSLGNWVLAEKFYHKAVEYSIAQGDFQNLSRWTQNLGIMELKDGKIEEALVLMKRGVDAAIQGGNSYHISSGYGNIGSIYMEQKDYANAAKYYEKAIISSKEKTLEKQWCESFSDALFRLADVAINIGDYKSSVSIYRRLIEVNNQYGGSPEFIAEAWIRIAEIFHVSSYFEEASQALLYALHIYTSINHSEGIRYVQNIMDQIARG